MVCRYILIRYVEILLILIWYVTNEWPQLPGPVQNTHHTDWWAGRVEKWVGVGGGRASSLTQTRVIRDICHVSTLILSHRRREILQCSQEDGLRAVRHLQTEPATASDTLGQC